MSVTKTVLICDVSTVLKFSLQIQLSSQMGACSVSILLEIFQGPGKKFLQGPVYPVQRKLVLFSLFFNFCSATQGLDESLAP